MEKIIEDTEKIIEDTEKTIEDTEKTIEGVSLPIKDIFQEEFEIPVFQRPYSWDESHCEQLCDDLFSFIDNTSEEYFLGSIVVYPKKGQREIFRVIDGQQRLTTLLMLMHALNSRVPNDELKKIIDIENSEPRVESKVLLKDDYGKGDYGQKDYDSLCEILKNKYDKLEEGNKFRENYQLLKNTLENESPKKVEEIINVLLGKVVMLFIQCKDQSNALTLFRTINDRGMSLDDTDIFKTRMFAVAENKDDFIKRWGDMDGHFWRFRDCMHIYRAKEKSPGKVIALRKYFDERWKDKKPSSEDVDKIMINLEKCYWLETNILHDSLDNHKYVSGLDEIAEKDYWKQKVYWKILRNYPNDYCLYPLKVFCTLHEKTGKTKTAEIDFHNKDKREEYMNLIEDTVRHFLFKGLVHNNVRKVTGISLEVCRAIYNKKGYNREKMADLYKRNIYKDEKNEEKDEKKVFKGKLEGDLIASNAYTRCIVLLGAFLYDEDDKKQDPENYSAFLEGEKSDKPEIEHILPKNSDNLDESWNANDKELHKKYLHNIGNLIPLTRRDNRDAKNHPFDIKKEKYKGSESENKVQDVKDLPNKWTPDDIEDRQKILLERLGKFFSEGSIKYYSPD